MPLCTLKLFWVTLKPRVKSKNSYIWSPTYRSNLSFTIASRRFHSVSQHSKCFCLNIFALTVPSIWNILSQVCFQQAFMSYHLTWVAFTRHSISNSATICQDVLTLFGFLIEPVTIILCTYFLIFFIICLLPLECMLHEDRDSCSV